MCGGIIVVVLMLVCCVVLCGVAMVLVWCVGAVVWWWVVQWCVVWWEVGGGAVVCGVVGGGDLSNLKPIDISLEMGKCCPNFDSTLVVFYMLTTVLTLIIYQHLLLLSCYLVHLRGCSSHKSCIDWN